MLALMERPPDGGVHWSLRRGAKMVQGEDGIARPVEDDLGDFLRIAQIGADPTASARILILASEMASGEWPPDRWTRITVRAFGKQVPFVVSTMSDLLVLRDVFFFEDYGNESGDPTTILDLGSNIGASVVYFRLKYPGARIVAVEPDPRAFAKLRENTAAFEGIELRQVAIAAENGETVLHRHDQSWSSSLIESWQGTEVESVRTQTLDDLVDEVGLDSIDLLKMDIEGAEFQVLPTFRQLGQVQTLIGELHAYLSDEPPQKFLDYLRGFSVEVHLAGQAAVPFRATRH